MRARTSLEPTSATRTVTVCPTCCNRINKTRTGRLLERIAWARNAFPERKPDLTVHECGRRHGENEPRSVGTHLGAHGMTVLLQVASSQPNSSAQSFTASFRRWPFGLPMTLSAPRHGDFPRSMLGSKLPVCWLRGRASPASSAVVISTLHLQMPSSQRVCLQASCPTTVQSKLSMLHRVVHECGRRHGENEPRSVGTHLGAHGMTVLLQVASSQPNSSAQSFTASFRRWPFGLPMTLSAPRHGDFPRSMLGSKLPVCWLRGRASPASSAVVISTLHLQMPSSQRVCLQASCPTTVQSKLLMLHRVVHECGRRHGENEPRSVGTHLGAHGMTVLLQVASSQPNSSAQSFTASFRRWPFGLSMTLSAPRHGDFPRSMLGSKLPVCWLRGRASPASSAVVISTLHLQMPSSQRVCLQAACPKICTIQTFDASSRSPRMRKEAWGE